MNEVSHDLPLNDQRLLDLLVDGELADEQRRELLLSLDGAPDGWRRCALAFLEAQSWGREIRLLANEPAPVAVNRDGPTAIALAPRRGWRVRAAYLPLAMAASFLLAFALGLALRPATLGNGGQGGSDAQPVQLAADNSSDGGAAVLPGAPGSTDAPQAPNEATPRWGTVKFVVDHAPDGTPREVELPAVEGDALDQSWLTGAPAAIAPELQQVFERLGHQVRQERELVPIPLEDGRQLVVPVDRVRFTPAGKQGYQ